MTDLFALLDQPRRPWLEPDALKAAFHRQAALQHPDAALTGDAAQFAQLNRAYSTLRDPALRLRHLLELEFGAESAQSLQARVPAALADLFMELAGRRQKLDAFLARQKAASSPLAKALLLAEKGSLNQSWRAMEQRLGDASAAAARRMRELDARWEPRGESGVREDLAELQQELAYLGRWNAQLHEALFALEG